MVMLVRILTVVAAAFAAGQSLAEPMNADAARRFVMGKRFAYHCFDGTRGEGRVYGDGSVAGTVQIRGNGPENFVTLPSGTLKVQGQSYCASSLIEPISRVSAARCWDTVFRIAISPAVLLLRP
jgi:hypothetical protein